MLESTSQFLERYSDKIDDTKELLTLGRSLLKEFEYVDLLITLASADIKINESDIFNISYDKHVVTWEINDTLIHNFYDNLDKNNLAKSKTFPGLDKISVGLFVHEYFDVKYKGKAHVQLFRNPNYPEYYKLSDKVEFFATINEDNNNLEAVAKLRDNHGNPIILKAEIRIGHFYDHVGYGWNQQKFNDRVDYLTRIIEGVVS